MKTKMNETSNRHADYRFVEAYFQGDDNQFAKWLYGNYKMLLGISLHYTKDLQASEDVISNLAIELISIPRAERMSRFQPDPSRPLGAIQTRVKLRSIDAFRKSISRNETSLDVLPFSNAADDNDAEQDDKEITHSLKMECLDEAKKSLTAMEKDILEIHLRGGKNEEIQRKYAMSEDGPRVIKQRIFRKLARHAIQLMKSKKEHLSQFEIYEWCSQLQKAV